MKVGSKRNPKRKDESNVTKKISSNFEIFLIFDCCDVG